MALEPSIRNATMRAWKAYTAPTTASVRDAAKKVVQDPSASASLLLVATKHLLEPGFFAWDPDTVVEELERLGLPGGQEERVRTVLALVASHQYLVDYRVFGATVEVLTDGQSIPGRIPQPSVEALAWASFEMQLLGALLDAPEQEGEIPAFGDDVPPYVAAVLADQGYVTTPDFLGFAASELTYLLNPEARDLALKTKDAWDRTPKESIESRSFDDTPLGVQLQRLAEIRLYLKSRADAVINELASFGP